MPSTPARAVGYRGVVPALPSMTWSNVRAHVTRPALGLLSATILAVALIFVVGTVATAGRMISATVGMAGFSAFLLWLVARSRHWFLDSKRTEYPSGPFVVSAEGLAFGNGHFVPRERLEGGLVTGSGLRFAERGGGTLEFEGPRSEAAAMLDLLGFGAGQQAVTLPVNRNTRGAAFAVMPFFSLLLAARAAGLGAVVGLVALGVFAALNVGNVVRVLRRPRAVTVGLDLVRIERTLGVDEEIPIADVVDAVADLRSVVVTCRDGRVVVVPCDLSRDASAIAERISEAKAAAAGHGAPAAAALARDGRSTSDWLDALRALLAEGRDAYRGGVDRPTLLATLEDPGVDADVRAAAAVALRGELRPDERARLRVARDTVADPRLRVALEAVDEGDDDAVESALRDFERAT